MSDPNDNPTNSLPNQRNKRSGWPSCSGWKDTEPRSKKLKKEAVTISFKNNVNQQIFAFPFDIIKHILADASYSTVKKLYFTCKYFPQKYCLYLIDEFKYGKISFLNDSTEKWGHSKWDLFHSKTKKVCIGDTLWAAAKFSKKWFPKIEKCTIKKLNVLYEDLLWSDFKKLAEFKTIEELSVKKIINCDAIMVPVEYIIAYTSNLYVFEIMNTHVALNSIKEICNSLKSNKIKTFSMYNVDDHINVEDYLTFLQAHCCHRHTNSMFSVLYSAAVPLNEQKEFTRIVKSEIEKWPKPKPIFTGIRLS